jgi:hypothetical protein
LKITGNVGGNKMSNAMNGLIKHYHDLFYKMTGLLLPKNGELCILENGKLGLKVKDYEEGEEFLQELYVQMYSGRMEDNFRFESGWSAPCSKMRWNYDQ